MGKRRTKKQKVEARLRWDDAPKMGELKNLSFSAVNIQEKALDRSISYVPELQLGLPIIKGDLTRTLLVTILALILQLGLYAYLQKGGWEKLLPILAGVSL